MSPYEAKTEISDRFHRRAIAVVGLFVLLYIGAVSLEALSCARSVVGSAHEANAINRYPVANKPVDASRDWPSHLSAEPHDQPAGREPHVDDERTALDNKRALQ
jgi:hypothetical protein